MNDQAKSLRAKMKRTETKLAKTISIVSGKGGVGKSNFALNFSMELLSLQKKVILFDLDVGMGNIDILLGLHAEKTIIDMLQQRLSIFSIIEKGPKKLSYIAGGSSLVDLFTMSDEQMDYFLQQYEKLLTDYDYIIFDLGAGISEENLFFNLASDECFIVTTPEPTAITDAYSFIKQLVRREKKMPIYIVINRCFSKKIGKNTLDRFANVADQFLQKEVIKLGVLPNDPVVSKAVMKQTPYTLLNKGAPISRAIKQLTDRYVHQNNHNNQKPSLSFTQRLKKLFRKGNEG